MQQFLTNNKHLWFFNIKVLNKKKKKKKQKISHSISPLTIFTGEVASPCPTLTTFRSCDYEGWKEVGGWVGMGMWKAGTHLKLILPAAN